MTRLAAAFLVACILVELGSAACARAQAAAPFPEVPLQPPPARPHTWAYVAMGSGVVLVGASFLLSEEADRTYEQYLLATEPAEIEDLYDRTVRLDMYTRVALLGGQVIFATGLYLRFIRKAPANPVSLSLGPTRCALSYHF